MVKYQNKAFFYKQQAARWFVAFVICPVVKVTHVKKLPPIITGGNALEAHFIFLHLPSWGAPRVD